MSRRRDDSPSRPVSARGARPRAQGPKDIEASKGPPTSDRADRRTSAKRGKGSTAAAETQREPEQTGSASTGAPLPPGVGGGELPGISTTPVWEAVRLSVDTEHQQSDDIVGLGFVHGDALQVWASQQGPAAPAPEVGPDSGGAPEAPPPLARACALAAIRARVLLRERGAEAPPVDVGALAAQLDIAVTTERMTREVTAFLLVDGGRASVRLNSAQAHFRRRFALARALGHLLLHLDPLGRPNAAVLIGGLVPASVTRVRRVDTGEAAGVRAAAAADVAAWREVFRDLWGAEVDVLTSRRRTAEGNAFAAELLMPAEALLRDLGRRSGEPALDLFDERAMKRLAQRYDVTPTALAVQVLSSFGVLGARWPLQESAWEVWARSAGWAPPPLPPETLIRPALYPPVAV